MGSVQPFASVGYVPSSQELIDLAFRRASKIEVTFPPKADKLRKAKIREQARINTINSILCHRLGELLKKFPRLDKIHPFYRELADVLFGVDQIKHSLGAVKWARDILKKIAREHRNRVKKSKTPQEAANHRRAYYGRVASILEQIEGELSLLKEAAAKLSKLPSLSLEYPTIVVSGYTNVGKSTFVKKVSTASPKIASYPFTTQSIILGHVKEGRRVICQVMDTPGLLDRPLSERNKVELQAIAALKHAADVIVFLLDPSETCGYPMERQFRLLDEIRELFKGTPMLVVCNKVDICQPQKLQEALRREPKALLMSAKTGKGVDEVLKKALSLVGGSASK